MACVIIVRPKYERSLSKSGGHAHQQNLCAQSKLPVRR